MSSPPNKSLEIAILGTRGIPANYGGFETFAENLATRLVDRGHSVTVYGRSHHVQRTLKEFRGVRLVVLPTLRSKYTDTIMHTLLSALHAVGRPFQVVLICNAANALFCLLPRLRGQKVALNVDGIERHRKKWGPAGRLYYRLSEWLATVTPNCLITDALVIRDYYQQQYLQPSVCIPYGADARRCETTFQLQKLGLEPRRYFLYVSRLEPENNAHRVLAAYQQVNSALPLVLVGWAPYAAGYIEQLKSRADQRVIFAGAVYGQGYRELLSHARAYIHATEVGGTHPALIEAMAVGNIVVCAATPENIEVLGWCGLTYAPGDAARLSELLQQVADEPARFEELGAQARQRAMTHYDWDQVTDRYEQLFEALAAGSFRYTLGT